MRRLGAAVLAAGLTSFIPIGRAAAQIDYRNLDHGRPVATEDAYPVERYALELLVPFRSAREPGGERLHLIPLGLELGILDNTQLGIGLPLAAVETPGADTESGLAGLEIVALHSFNTESPALPALSAGASLALPVGSLAGDHARVSLKGIATRSFGLTRLHLNAVWSFGAEDEPGVEVAPRWGYSLAVDRTVFRKSLLLVGELLTRRTLRDTPVEVNAAIGGRYQLTPTLVVDAGLSRRLRSRAGPDYDLTIGISHTFGVSWLMPREGR